MKEHKKLDDKIKSSFDSLNRKAPDMLWNQLADSLPTDSTATAESQPENARLYHKVRDSFSSLRQKAPQHVWQDINRQLNIDLVWTRLSRELDKTSSTDWHVARWAAVLLLFLLSFAGGHYLYQQQKKDAGMTENIADLSILSAEKEMAVEVDQADHTSIAEQTGKPVISDVKGAEETSTADGQQENLITLFQPSPKDKRENASASSGSSYHIRDETSRSDEALITGDEQTSASGSFLSSRNSGSAGKPTTLSSMEEEFEKGSGDSPVIRQSLDFSERSPTTFIPYRIARLPLLPPVVKESSFLITAVVLDSIALEMLTEADEESGMQAGSFSIGPVLAYNSSWLLNNETRSSFDKGSLISANPTYKQNLGIALHYTFNHSSTLATEFHFISKAGQEYNTFSDGYYQKKELELSYYKLYLHYQRNFFPHRQRLLSNLTLKAGLYGGLLYRKNGEIRTTKSTYSSFDYGARLAFGQERRLNRIIIGYGISGERGLTNIFMGSDKMPARFNKTYTLNFGPYLNFRYH